MSESMLGDILFVNLTSRETSKRPYTKELSSLYIGCRGYNVALLWELVPKGIEPLGPDNLFPFGSNTPPLAAEEGFGACPEVDTFH